MAGNASRRTEGAFYQTNPAYDSDDSNDDDDASHDYIDPSEWEPNGFVSSGNQVTQLGTETQRRKQYAIAMDVLKELPSRNMDGPLEPSTECRNENGLNAKHRPTRQDSKVETMRFRAGSGCLRYSDANADKLYQMLTKDPDTTMENIKENLRNMNQCLTLKRSVKARLDHNDEQIEKQRQVSGLKKLGYRLAMNLEHAKDETKELFHSLDLWHSHLKVVQGHFGSGVASYFFFLRRLFYLNLAVFTLLMSFVVIPQLCSNTTGNKNAAGNLSFTGKELLTGGDTFSDTILYYGHYSNATLPSNYSIPQAYIFTNGAVIFLCLILLTYSLAKSYRINYVEVSGELKNVFCNKLFSAWDYSIEKEDAARLKSCSIFNEILELLASERKDVEEKSCGELMHLYFWRVFINIMILGALCSTGYVTYYLLENMKEIFLKELALSIAVSVIAFVVPMIFSAMSKWEGYSSKQTEIYLNMVRIVLLRIVVLSVVTYFWLYKENPSRLLSNGKSNCWETQLGEEVYRLMVVDLFCILLLSTLGMELLRHLMHKWCCSVIGEPEFDIAQNTLDLIYTQTLTWLGFFYCPLLPLMALIKLVIVFYVKRISVIQNCRPSLKPWRAAHAQTVFLMLAFVNFLLTVVATGYSVFVISPSRDCGPFRHLDSRYDTVLDLLYSVDTGGKYVAKVFKVLVSPGVVAGIILFLCVIVYYVRATAKAHEEMVNLLREQLIMEGKDKVFLLKLFKVAFEQADMNSLVRKNKFGEQDPFDDPRGSVGDVRQQGAQPSSFVNEGYRDSSVQNRHYSPSEQGPLPPYMTGYTVAKVSAPPDQFLQPKHGWGRFRERSPDTRSSSSQETPAASEWRRPSAVPVDGVSSEHLRSRLQEESREDSPHIEGGSRHSTPHEDSPHRSGASNPSTSITPSGSLDRRGDHTKGQKRNIPSVLTRPVHQHGFQYLTRDSPSYSPTRTSHHSTPPPKDSPKQRSFPAKQW